MQSVTEWAQLNFGSCELGDKRRMNRLVRVAEQVANNPAASLPEQTEQWADLKAAYRLFDRNKVTFEAIARPHWELTKQSARGRCLVIGDTTELDFGKDRQWQWPRILAAQRLTGASRFRSDHRRRGANNSLSQEETEVQEDGERGSADEAKA